MKFRWRGVTVNLLEHKTMLEAFPDWFRILFMSMVPWFESRYTLPLAISIMGWEWWKAFPIAILGNMIPIPLILIFMNFIENRLKKFRFWSGIMDRFFEFTKRRADYKIRRFKHLGLILFVAIPIPFTGAWTGALIAYLFNLKFTKSIITIFIGVIIAASIMTYVTLSGINLLIIYLIIIIIGLIIGLLTIIKINKID
jgi:uncharacterized membrane protein